MGQALAFFKTAVRCTAVGIFFRQPAADGNCFVAAERRIRMQEAVNVIDPAPG